MASHLIFNLKRECSEMCKFVRARIELFIVKSNTLLLRDPNNKEALICQNPELSDGAVMALLVNLRGEEKSDLQGGR